LVELEVRAGVIEPAQGVLRRRNFGTVPLVDDPGSAVIDTVVRFGFHFEVRDLLLSAKFDVVLDEAVFRRRFPVACSASTVGEIVSRNLGTIKPGWISPDVIFGLEESTDARFASACDFQLGRALLSLAISGAGCFVELPDRGVETEVLGIVVGDGVDETEVDPLSEVGGLV
jgi:hypothetical protein